MSILGYVTIAAFLVVMASVGFVFKAFNRDIADYFKGGCRGTWWLVGASAFMSSFSTWTFTGAAGVAFEAGWSVAAIFVGNAAGYFINYLWFAAWFRQLRVTTAPEIIRLRYNTSTQQTYAGLGIVLGLLHGGLHLFGLSIFCSAVFGIPTTPLILVLGVVVVVYSVSGGSWAVMATDFLQGLILVPITLLASWVALDAVGGLSGLFGRIHEMGLNAEFAPVKAPGQFAEQAFTWGWISAIFINKMVTNNTMGAGARYFAVKDGRDARRAALLCTVVMLLGSLIWFIPPMVARLLFADQVLAMPLNKPAESAYAVACLNLLPSGLMGLVVVAMFAATMSSMDTGINRNAAILVKDVYPALCRLFNRTPREESRLLGASRIVSLLFGAGIIGLALYFSRAGGKGMFNAMLNIGSYLGTPMVIPMFFGLFVRRVPQWSALTAMGCGLACSLVLAASPSAFGVSWNFQQVFFINAGVTLGVYLLTALAWSMTGEAYREKVREFFQRMHTPVDFEKEVGGSNDLSQLLVIGGFGALLGLLVLILALFEDGTAARVETALVGLTLLVLGGGMAAAGHWMGKRRAATASVKAGTLIGLLAVAAIPAARGAELPGEAGRDVRWTVHEDFQEGDWRQRWRAESQGAVIQASPQGLRVTNAAGGETKGTTLWWHQPLPRDIVVRIKARTLEPAEGNACNLNAVLAATETDGALPRPGRSGEYKELHAIPDYIVTFTGGDTPGWSRIRRNPGFHNVSEAEIRSEPGQDYELVYRLENGRVQVWFNGRHVHDWQDSQPLSGGSFALRTWRSNVLYESVDIGVIGR